MLRATVAVVAGSMSFNYDEILQLRVAVSEAFGLAVRHLPEADTKGKSVDVKGRFVIGDDRLEVIVTCPRMERGDIESAEDVESRVVLESLVDSVAIGAETSDERVIRLVKFKTVAGG